MQQCYFQMAKKITENTKNNNNTKAVINLFLYPIKMGDYVQEKFETKEMHETIKHIKPEQPKKKRKYRTIKNWIVHNKSFLEMIELVALD